MEDTIRSSIYESIEKSTRLKEMAEKKYGAKERVKRDLSSESEQQLISDKNKKSKTSTEKKNSIPKKRKSLNKIVENKNTKKIKRTETEAQSSYRRDVNQTEIVESQKNFNEFKISDAGSKVGYEGFSESMFSI